MLLSVPELELSPYLGLKLSLNTLLTLVDLVTLSLSVRSIERPEPRMCVLHDLRYVFPQERIFFLRIDSCLQVIFNTLLNLLHVYDE